MLSEQMQQVLHTYNEGLALYKKREFKMAAEIFKKALTIKKDDGPSQVYLDRCLHFIEEPPPPDWDGVYVMKTK
ncbi:MAG: tetratricopeptide repeat protein [Spirochaetes bacterium]|nr:tetratricopeptide repeat protein [Spirochaetota bacterium]MBX3723699.1 tetratricopeptide repeat protein [Turneriella sp.]